MIRYRLICTQDHEFEAWFRDSAGYDEQTNNQQVTCPQCGDVDVTKALMAPGLKTSSNVDRFAEAKAHDVAQRILAAVGKLQEKVVEECDYVGDEFADEARAIHHGEVEERGIYGEATDVEVEELEDEGIPFFRLPGTSQRRDN